MKIENLIRTHPYLIDDEGKLNCRRLGDHSHAIVLIFKECDINNIKDTVQQNMEEYCTQRKIPKYEIKIYEGNPLDTAASIRVKVRNPDPNADATYYSDFGEVEKMARKQGFDLIDYKTLNCFLPAAEEYYRAKKKKKSSQPLFFYLHPEEKNRAAPQYSILTKNYTKPTNLNENVQLILDNFPIEKAKEVKLEATKISTDKAEPKKKKRNPIKQEDPRTHL